MPRRELKAGQSDYSHATWTDEGLLTCQLLDNCLSHRLSSAGYHADEAVLVEAVNRVIREKRVLGLTDKLAIGTIRTEILRGVHIAESIDY